MVRKRSWKSASGALSPLTVFTSTGKNEMSTAAATLDHQPVPSQSTSRGAIATMGVVLSVMANGKRPCSIVLNRTKTIAATKAEALAIAKPHAASPAV